MTDKQTDAYNCEKIILGGGLCSPECQVFPVSLECGVLLLLQLYHDISGLLARLLISLIKTPC